VIYTTITSAAGMEVSRRANHFAAAQFDAARSVEHRMELDLKALAPGDYLLTFAATGAGGVGIRRETQFTVR
jgi:hypothetical protein